MGRHLGAPRAPFMIVFALVGRASASVGLAGSRCWERVAVTKKERRDKAVAVAMSEIRAVMGSGPTIENLERAKDRLIVLASDRSIRLKCIVDQELNPRLRLRSSLHWPRRCIWENFATVAHKGLRCDVKLSLFHGYSMQI